MCEQGSPEWRQSRVGRLCASDAGAMLSTTKSGEAAARRDLRIKLALERLTSEPAEDVYVNADMQRGRQLEASARSAYEAQTGAMVSCVGFLRSDDLMVGCSPDGLLDDGRGGLELKCPRPANHLKYLRGGVVPTEYVGQLRHSLWVTGADYWDFASYAPQFPEGLQLFICRMPRVDVDLGAYESAVRAFLSEVETEVQALRTMTNLGAVLQEALA
ncbi:MAG TPA: YqaJ viral recombinase family protein [Gemmatimonadaceae bacterium]|nr:YqaJ viral recombinase family protein [Gemmatimonadaceae bacterium]